MTQNGAQDLLSYYLEQHRPVPVRRMLHRECLIEDGHYIDRDTGEVLGRHLDLDDNSGSCCPLYYYCRSWRFIGLFNLYNIRIRDQNKTLRYFEALETAWEEVKKNYTRVYFLTQKLILRQICQRLGIFSTQPDKRPISDLRRYRAQIAIFNDLWKIVLTNKCHNSTSATNRSSDSSLPIQNYR